jgi:hypothetical protein
VTSSQQCANCRTNPRIVLKTSTDLLIFRGTVRTAQ